LKPGSITSFFLFTTLLVLTEPHSSFGQDTAAIQEEAMRLTSPAFQQETTIPDQYTCKGANISPELSRSDVPSGARSLALIADDPDAPKGTYTHWVAYNIAIDKKNLSSNIPAKNHMDGLMQGKNDFGREGYGGPCPPRGDKAHRYSFRLYALDTTLDLKPDATKADLEAAMKGHVLDQAELLGRFGR
jgi:Raf kinase inhibitor-like YbhB/YbcL family protein